MGKKGFLIFLCLFALWGCSSNVQKEDLSVNVSFEGYSGVEFKEIFPLSLKQIDKKEFEEQHVLSDLGNTRKNGITCSLKNDKYFIYEYGMSGGIKIYTTRIYNKPSDIFRLYRFGTPYGRVSDYNILSKFGSCRVENGELFKIKKDGSFLDDYPTKGETKLTYRNTMPDVLFEIAQGRYDTIFAYRFGKVFNKKLLQNKAQYFLLGEREVDPHSEYREFCHTLYSSPAIGDNQKQYYEKLLFRSESDHNHYYLFQYSLPTDGFYDNCPPPIFIDIKDSGIMDILGG